MAALTLWMAGLALAVLAGAYRLAAAAGLDGRLSLVAVAGAASLVLASVAVMAAASTSDRPDGSGERER
jgi:hypothetical protein